MNKRLIILFLLFVNVLFISCASKDDLTARAEYTNAQMEEERLREHETDYKKLKKQHLESQSEETRKMMKENEKLSRKQTPIKRKFSFALFGKRRCKMPEDEVLKAGVSDSPPPKSVEIESEEQQSVNPSENPVENPTEDLDDNP